MSRRGLLAAGLLMAACGGGKHASTAPPPPDDDDPPVAVGGAVVPQIVPQIASQTWYRSASVCGQGPYEFDVPVSDAKRGEDFELRLSTPRRVAITAVVLGDDQEVARTAALFDAQGRGSGKAENQRCVADAKDRLAAIRTGGGGGGGGSGTTVPDVPVGTTIVTPPPSTPQVLQIDELVPETSVEIVRFGWREDGRRMKRIRIRVWSVEPNDLDKVRFGVLRVEYRPNVPEVEYEAYLARIAAREEAARRRQEEAQRQIELERARRAEEERQRRQQTTVVVDVETARRRAEDERRRLEDERRRAEEETRRRLEREERERIRIAELERRRAIEAQLKLERERRRAAYCASHADSRDCWGAGGKRMHDEMNARIEEAAAYCRAHTEDVRCWSYDERARRTAVWDQRVRVATAPPKQPDGPPPAPRDETPPPKLSENAEWRPGYWQWTGSTWVWLAGMWRVPDADIVAEHTTTAPVAPPPPRSEEIPPPPMPTTIWVSGFWQWNGASYVWVAGSYQTRPEVGVTWRPAEWRVKSTTRGSVHILIPGGWVRGRR